MGEHPLADLDFSSLIQRAGLDIVGILGFDFLSRFGTKIDCASKLVSFYDRDVFEYKGRGRDTDVHIKEDVFEVQAVLDGVRAGTGDVDMARDEGNDGGASPFSKTAQVVSGQGPHAVLFPHPDFQQDNEDSDPPSRPSA